MHIKTVNKNLRFGFFVVFWSGLTFVVFGGLFAFGGPDAFLRASWRESGIIGAF
jgi:hypothetical protein